MTAYPPHLAEYVVEHWPTANPLRLSREHLREVLSVAFQASLTPEETRATRFRLLLTPSNALPANSAPNVGALPLHFERARNLTAEELRRLAPAVPFESSLIGVDEADGQLRIWGVAHSGPAWLAPTWGGRSVVPIWTRDPIVHVTGPGHLAVRSAGKLIGGLERGALVDTTMDVFESQWLPLAFQREHVENSLVGLVSQHMLRRSIQVIRGARHGGMILVADSSCTLAGEQSALELDGLLLKYRLVADEPSNRYRSLLSDILARTAEWADFAADESPELARLEQSVFEWSRLIANLAAIDGAVVLDKRFALVGFGAEVSSNLAGPPRVFRALDAEGTRREPSDLENVGTRHRAAYRFVHGHPHGLAIVISQDGGVTFVAKRENDVVFWEQSVSP